MKENLLDIFNGFSEPLRSELKKTAKGILNAEEKRISNLFEECVRVKNDHLKIMLQKGLAFMAISKLNLTNEYL